MEFTINRVRNILYKLSNHGLVSFIRKKDNRKGWYIYFWTLNALKSLEILEEKLQSEIKELESELSSKKAVRHYKCNICGIEINEEEALLHNFECLECVEVYQVSDTKTNVEEIE